MHRSHIYRNAVTNAAVLNHYDYNFDLRYQYNVSVSFSAVSSEFAEFKKHLTETP